MQKLVTDVHLGVDSPSRVTVKFMLSADQSAPIHNLEFLEIF